MNEKIFGEWTIEVLETDNELRMICDEDEMVILDRDNDIVALLSIIENGNIKVEKVSWNCFFGISADEKRMIFGMNEVFDEE